MKTALFILSIILLLSIAGNVYQYFGNRDREQAAEIKSEARRDSIRIKTAEILKADTLIRDIRAKMGKDKAKSDSVLKVKETRISALRQKIASLGGITPVEEADTTCARLIMVSSLKDSVIQKQDDLISTLELTHSAKVTDLETIIHAQSGQITASMAIGEAYKAELALSQSETRKAVRKSKFKNVVIALIGGVAIWMAVK